MPDTSIDILFSVHESTLQQISTDFKRSVYNQIDWTQRLIEIYGARGVGKTTLMLQKVLELQKDSSLLPLYVSVDHPYFFGNSLYDLADQFYKLGGTHLFIDEIHRYPAKLPDYDWSAEIKVIYDSFPSLIVVYSGSSVLELYKGRGDLSRRKIGYHIPGLSFREFLEFENILNYEILSLEEILSDHYKIAKEIIAKTRIIGAFAKYLKSGYYPFYKQAKDISIYYRRILEIINIVIENDIVSVLDVKYETVNKLKKLLSAISSSPPYTSQIKHLSELLRIKDYKTTLRLIELLEKAQLLLLLKQQAKGNKILHKPDKIYLNNTNLMYALDFGGINIGAVRETFFLNQVSYKHTVHYPKTADFLVDGRWLFEIGGKNKTGKQIAGQPEAFIAADDIEIGFGNKVPLWMFGFLY